MAKQLVIQAVKFLELAGFSGVSGTCYLDALSKLSETKSIQLEYMGDEVMERKERLCVEGGTLASDEELILKFTYLPEGTTSVRGYTMDALNEIRERTLNGLNEMFIALGTMAASYYVGSSSDSSTAAGLSTQLTSVILALFVGAHFLSSLGGFGASKEAAGSMGDSREEARVELQDQLRLLAPDDLTVEVSSGETANIFYLYLSRPSSVLKY
jgi:hypothetical protein